MVARPLYSDTQVSQVKTDEADLPGTSLISVKIQRSERLHAVHPATSRQHQQLTN